MSRLTRRNLLKLAGGSTAVVAIGGAGRFVPLPILDNGKSVTNRVTPLTKYDFTPLVGDRFRVEKSALENTELELAAVSSLSNHSAEDEYSFSVQFNGTSAEELDQGTYAMEHPALGIFPIFLVPSKASPGNSTFSAVFNRLQG